MGVYFVTKNVGETPKSMLHRLKKTIQYTKASYCGRLDPMASGKMLVLTDESCKDQTKYLSLDKVYTFNIIFGMSTASHDPLNDNIDFDFTSDIDIKKMKYLIKNKYTGKFLQEYPMCSSYTVPIEGKQTPLWKVLKRGIKLDVMPFKSVEVYKFDIIEINEVDDFDLFEDFIYDISKVDDTDGTFGKLKAIDVYSHPTGMKFTCVKCRAHVSSGTYIRKLAACIGAELGTGAIAYRINRCHI
jgi:tRNA pseudouridine(55) synthase